MMRTTKQMNGLIEIIHKAKNKVLDFIFPRRCVLCGKTNPQGKYEHVCPDCEHTLVLLNGARCSRCSEPIGAVGMPDMHGCPKCFDRNFKFDKSLCLCSFDGAAREMVHDLKYRTGAFVVHDMAKIAKQFPQLKEFITDAILIPVPLHNARAIRRRYNQSELIATMLTETFPEANARVKKVLKRTRSTPTQTTLDKDARAANIKNAFSVTNTKTLAALDRNANIVIVDDVMTTGATLSECAKALKKCGFKNVSAFTFAKRL